MNNIPNSGINGIPGDDEFINEYMIRFSNSDGFDDIASNNGYMSFWGGNSNSFKSEATFTAFDSSGSLQKVMASSHLLSNDFFISLRFYVKPDSTERVPSAGIFIVGTDGGFYTFSGIDWGCDADPNPCVNTWSESTIERSKRFNLFIPGQGRRCPNGNVGDAQCEIDVPGFSASYGATPEQWQNGVYGDKIFGNGAYVFSIGLNIGSYQRNCYFAFDWLETSLYADGLRVNFNAANTVPSAPSRPNFPLASPISNMEYEISWAVPQDSSINGYLVRCISVDGGGIRVAKVTSGSVGKRTIGNCDASSKNGPLVPGATYTCTVISSGTAASSGVSQTTLPFSV